MNSEQSVDFCCGRGLTRERVQLLVSFTFQKGKKKKQAFRLLLVRIFIVGTGVPDGPQNTKPRQTSKAVGVYLCFLRIKFLRQRTVEDACPYNALANFLMRSPLSLSAFLSDSE